MPAHEREPLDPLQASVRLWLEEVLTTTELSPTKLAQECGLAPSTIVRFLHDTRAKHTLSARTIAKIAARTGVAAPTEIGSRPDTDPRMLQRALARAREIVGRVPSAYRPRLEAELAAEIYDALISAQLSGQPLDEALRIVGEIASRRLRVHQRG